MIAALAATVAEPLTDGEKSLLWVRLFGPHLKPQQRLSRTYVSRDGFDAIVSAIERAHGQRTEGEGMIPELPEPDCQTDWDRGGEGDPAYTPELVKQIQEAAYKAGQESVKGTA